jgi:Protein of unknown function (DUF3563)
MKKASLFNQVSAALAVLRRALGALTENEAHRAYLAEAQDRVDLERRMRELDQPRRSSSLHFGYGWNG